MGKPSNKPPSCSSTMDKPSTPQTPRSTPPRPPHRHLRALGSRSHKDDRSTRQRRYLPATKRHALFSCRNGVSGQSHWSIRRRGDFRIQSREKQGALTRAAGDDHDDDDHTAAAQSMPLPHSEFREAGPSRKAAGDGHDDDDDDDTAAATAAQSMPPPLTRAPWAKSA